MGKLSIGKQLCSLKAFWLLVLALGYFMPIKLFAQNDVRTNNQFIYAVVKKNTGWITVFLPPGRPGLDGQLNYTDHSYFTCQINNEIFTNNDQCVKPGNGGANWQLTDGVTTKVGDTVYTKWTRNGIEIVQSVYPLAFERSGQISMNWTFSNPNNANAASVSCQYLNDLEISDPTDHAPENSNDGPIVLHRYAYKDKWQRIPTTGVPMPWFYGGFLRDLPTTNPGVSSFGYLDNPALKTIAPSRITIGDWRDMSLSPWSNPTPDWPIGGALSTDNAMLIEFPFVGVAKGKTIRAGSTTYGTGEFEVCNGPLVGVLFYPHRIKYDRPNDKYVPNPFQVELLTFNPNQVSVSSSTKMTLTVEDPMVIIDTNRPNPTIIGKSLRLPLAPSSGDLIPAGSVAAYDWWVKVNPLTLCTGDALRSLRMTGSNSSNAFAFDNDTCEHEITIECAETDVDPPAYSQVPGTDTFHVNVTVSDKRITDKGLKSITWVPGPGTDSAHFANFVITYADSIKACATDKAEHTIFIWQKDSTIGGCISFTFEDCLGHQSFYDVCMKAHSLVQHFDTKKPEIYIIARSGTYDGSTCNNRFDSLAIFDTAEYDSGLKSIQVVSSNNMTISSSSVTAGDQIKRLSVAVTDSMKDGNICIAATDLSNNISDTTCITYCTIPDTIPPTLSVLPVSGIHGSWNVTVEDNRPWDRLIGAINITAPYNVTPTSISVSNVPTYSFTMATIDTTKPSGFCIQAIDLAGNMTDSICVSVGVDTDGYAPNISLNPPLTTSPTVITVSVNDRHFNDPGTNLDTVKWDTGIDSVWFTGDVAKFMFLPSKAPLTTIKLSSCPMDITDFQIGIIDSLSDSSACLGINAIDCHKNASIKTWCYPFQPDKLPPVLTVKYLDKDNIRVTISDTALYDRGWHSISTSPVFLNLTTFDTTAQKGDAFKSFILQRPNRNQSTSGGVSSLDYWGSLDVTRVPTHSASIDFNVWVQDFGLQKGILIDGAQTFQLPVVIVKNDAVALDKKTIKDFAFDFTMLPDQSIVEFTGVNSVGTLSGATGWTATAAVTGNKVSVTGHGSTILGTGSTSDTLVFLTFKSKISASTQNVELQINNIGTESIVYNNGRDTNFNGVSATATMPPPWGNISGGTIVIIGACSPSLKSAHAGNSIILDVPTPNPISHRANVTYNVPSDEQVQLSMYDMLGRQVKTLVNLVQKAGYYSIDLDVSALANGQYNLRLQTGNEVQSRMVVVHR